MIPAAVIESYPFDGGQPIAVTGGLINTTYRIEKDGEPIAVLQKLHRIPVPTWSLDPASWGPTIPMPQCFARLFCRISQR